MAEKEHELKAEPFFFRSITRGCKTFEVRLNDRNFKVGDWIVLKEWNIDERIFTGNSVRVKIKFILYADSLEAAKNNSPLCFFDSIKPGYVVIGF